MRREMREWWLAWGEYLAGSRATLAQAFALYGRTFGGRPVKRAAFAALPLSDWRASRKRRGNLGQPMLPVMAMA